jgi:sterol desaturase/sphingolipid hydroxylase (fatty acid hydroxylase superfamily)
MTFSAWAGTLGAILLGLIYTSSLEWCVHRFVFHGLGRRKGSRFAFHYLDHHRACRRNQGRDDAFAGGLWTWSGYSREVFGIGILGVLHAPLLLVAPAFYLGAVLGGLNYHRIHKRSHVDPEWCRTHLRHHWDHHMGDGRAAEANWGVTSPWLDIIMGTRVRWTASDERPDDNAPQVGAN